MTTDQPRDEKGRFVRIDNDNPQDLSNDGTLGIFDESQVTGGVEWTNVSVDKLRHAIDVAKEYDDMVRIATMNETGQDEDGTYFERGMILLRASPSSDEVIALAGKKRMRESESYE